MQGYDVRTIDGDYIAGLVEHGLLTMKHALPMVFAEVDADEQVVRTTLSKDLIHHSPKVNGEIDRVAIAALRDGRGIPGPPTRGQDALSLTR